MHRRTLAYVAVSLVLLSAPALLAQEAQPAPPEATSAPPEAAAAPAPAPASPASGQPAQGPGGGQPAPSPSPFGGPYMLLVLALAMVALFWWSGRTRRKQESKRREMLSCLKKGDKVTTIGGIVGTLMEVREDEVVLKIDENSNTRIHMARWAVRGVGEEARKQAPEEHR